MTWYLFNIGIHYHFGCWGVDAYAWIWTDRGLFTHDVTRFRSAMTRARDHLKARGFVARPEIRVSKYNVVYVTFIVETSGSKLVSCRGKYSKFLELTAP